MSLTVGIDPGSRITGFGVVEKKGSSIVYVASGIIRVDTKKPKHLRLMDIKTGLDDVITRHEPSAIAIEDIFVARNPKSALTLGEARGVALLASAEAGVDVFEYSAREVKRSVAGSGAAHKSQVAFMIGKLLMMDKEPATEDETDALAVAFCHVLRTSGIAGRIRCIIED
ncbi:MAG: crossover junction endodeoxyribonuclease RuvC [Candidatus Krumholzibacteriota bacterium]|nr:crossover junction endodeoxyribonuclease RuvC [Candidatus Krumholzibacteriota bacterium]